MNRLKRSISIVLVLLLLLSIAVVAPVSVSAATDGGYTYEVSGEKATITGYSGREEIIEIPSELGNYTVTSIGNGAFEDGYVTNVVIPKTVISIGDNAFKGCHNLTSVTIPASVTSIGSGAFFDCSSNMVLFVDEDSYAESYAVSNRYDYYNANGFICSEPEYGEVSIIGYVGTETNVEIPYEIKGNTVVDIDNHAFENNTKIKSVVIPNSVRSIGVNAFSGCQSLISVTIPYSVSYIGNSAFFDCGPGFKIHGQEDSAASDYALSNRYEFEEECNFTFSDPINGKVELLSFIGKVGDDDILVVPDEVDGKAVTSIAPFAFANNPTIKSVFVPKSVKTIGDKAFYNCSSLISAKIPPTVTSIGQYAFYGCSANLKFLGEVGSYVESYALAHRCEFVEDNDFGDELSTDFQCSDPDEYGNVVITAYKGSGGDVTIPSNINGYVVNGIGDNAFYKNTTVTSVTIPDSVTSIGNYAFDGCSKIQSVTIPDRVTSIGNLAFNKCAGLTTVTLSENLLSIGSAAFQDCTNIKSITLPDNIVTIGANAFYNCKKLGDSLVIPSFVESIGEYAFYHCESIMKVTVLSKDVTFGQFGVFEGHNVNMQMFGYVPSTARTYATNNSIKFYNINEYSNPTSNYYYKRSGASNVTYVSTFEEAWSNALSTSSGVVGTFADVKLSKSLVVPEYQKIVLELNGHVLDRGLTKESASARDNVITVSKAATLTVYGGNTSNPEPQCSLSFPAWRTDGVLSNGYDVTNRGLITGGYTSKNGGGIYVEDLAEVHLHYTAVSGNRAEGDAQPESGKEFGCGGGIAIGGNFSDISMDHSEISYNYAKKRGGGVALLASPEGFNYDSDNYTLKGDGKGELGEGISSISYNGAKEYGGGVYVTANKCVIDGVQIDYNSSGSDGGGLYMWGRKGGTVKNCVIAENTSGRVGGGICNLGDANSADYDSTVDENNGWFTNNQKGLFTTDYNTYRDLTVIDNTAQSFGDGIYNAPGIDIAFLGVCYVTTNGTSAKRQNLYLSGVVEHETERGHYAVDDEDSSIETNTGYVITDKNMHECSSNYTVGRIETLSWKSEIYVTYGENRDDTRLTKYYKYGTAAVNEAFESDKEDSHFDFKETNRLYYYEYETVKIRGFEPQTKRHIYYYSYVDLVDGKKPVILPTIEFNERKAVPQAGRFYNDQPVMQGIYTYLGAEGDSDGLFYYSDGYFMESAQNYNTHLASLSSCLVTAAMNSKAGSTGDNGNYVFKGKNIRRMMIDMGCKSSDIILSDTYTTKPWTDSIGYCIGRKKLANDDDLIIIAVRGGGYEAEWATNVELGESGEHAGFSSAASKVFGGLRNFLEDKNIDGTSSKTKFWIAGFSRAGATSNLTAKRIVDKFDNKGVRTFAYPIEAPKGGVESAKKSGCNYDCIHNVINYRDIVPWVAMGKLGFIRYGVDHFVPGSDVENKYSEGVPHDNYTEILNSETYKAQREKMLVQLKRLNQKTVYNDFFKTATIKYIEGGALGWDKIISPRGVTRKKIEDWLPAFWDHFTEWTFDCGGDAARKKYTEKHYLKNLNGPGYKEDAHGSKSFQQGLMAFLDLLMAPSEKGDAFLSGLSDLDLMEDIGVTLLLEIYTSYLNDVPVVGSFTNITYDELHEKLWGVLESKLKAKGFTDDELKDYGNYLYSVLRPLLNYISHDYKDNNQDDLGTMIYNAGNMIMNHDPEVATAWIRSYDSYYTEYTIEAPVKYVGKNCPQAPIVEVKSYLTGEVTTYTYDSAYNAENVIDVCSLDEIRFKPESSDYGEDEGDIYYYCFTNPNGIDLDKTTKEYGWHVFNQPFNLDSVHYDVYEDWSEYYPESFNISVFAERDGLLSNKYNIPRDTTTIDTYKNVLVPDSMLVRTFTFNVTPYEEPIKPAPPRPEPIPEPADTSEGGSVDPEPSSGSENNNVDPETPADTSENNNVEPETPADASENNNVEPETPAGTSENNNNDDITPVIVNPVTVTDIGSCKITGIKSKTYNGKAQTQKITIKNGFTTLKLGTDYTVAYKNNKNAGTATITITGKSSYKGTVKKTFKIAKAANPMTVKVRTLTADAKKTKTFGKSKAFTISKAQGSVTFAKKSGNKKITINQKTGKITVKKGLEKGKTYTVKITVKAAGKSNYNSKSKTVTVKVKVK